MNPNWKYIWAANLIKIFIQLCFEQFLHISSILRNRHRLVLLWCSVFPVFSSLLNFHPPTTTHHIARLENCECATTAKKNLKQFNFMSEPMMHNDERLNDLMFYVWQMKKKPPNRCRMRIVVSRRQRQRICTVGKSTKIFCWISWTGAEQCNKTKLLQLPRDKFMFRRRYQRTHKVSLQLSEIVCRRARLRQKFVFLLPPTTKERGGSGSFLHVHIVSSLIDDTLR